ncbi:hypothetical protein PY092_03115 [Muricauda sp. 334s03]|uniref:PepSY domain-containing protein n=1 Tax=Flagellimonas yonaguniensis TaxID=3031325 RepID=A0ABT5XVB2_9FLAO|nr:hypothetical protein [[Muricauda] yonaguniensis]MDF0715129.1 hypothetical protein [[Muricauda] yonaguniensis]
MKCNLILLLLLGIVQISHAQNKYERESRIDKDEFPNKSYSLIQDYLEDAKRVRFYQETDSAKKTFEAKFKKGRLHYSVEFNKNGSLEDVEFKIKERDIPNDTWASIMYYLEKNHAKPRVKKMQQQYSIQEGQTTEETLHNAFQNLILPEVKYELVFSAKKDKEFQEYEALFDSEGQLIRLRKSFPPSYDHVLY